MQTEREPGAVRGFGLEPDGGERLSWMGEPTMLKVTGQDTGGLYTVAEIITTPEGLVPLHVHHREDEAFFVLDGEVTFSVGDDVFDAGPGGFAFGPRDVPHRYTVRSASARMLMVFSPAGFEGFIRETSEPSDSLETVTLEDIDFDLIVAAAERHGAEVLE
ncbi:MAG: cupin domain-containing protein [Actinomycetota bacterium]